MPCSPLKPIVYATSILHPLYEAFNKLLMDSYAVWKWTGGSFPIPAVATAVVLATAEWIVQYKYIAVRAQRRSSNATDYIQLAETTREKNYTDELWATVMQLAAVSEGIESAIGLQILLEKISAPVWLTIAAPAFSYLLRKTKTANADAYDLWEHRKKAGAPELNQTWVYTISSYIPGLLQRLKGIINVNTFSKEAQPNYQALVHSLAIYTALSTLGAPLSVAIGVGILGATGERYAQNFDQSIAKVACEKIAVAKDLFLEQVWTKMAIFYDYALAGLFNGKWLVDIVGILIPPMIFNALLKAGGNSSMGFTAAAEVIEKLPLLLSETGIADIRLAPYNFEISVTLSAVTFIAGLIQVYARYKTDDGEKGMGPSIKKTYSGASIWSLYPSDVAERASGLMTHTINFFKSFCTNTEVSTTPMPTA